MNTYLQITVDLLTGLVLLFAITKVLGKTQMNQITPFEFISALVLGELVGNAIFDREVGLGQIAFAVTLWGILLYSIEKLELNVLKWRGFLEGNPSIVINKGVIDRNQLKKNKVSINQLQNLLRQKDVFSIREIDYAILESNGQLTVMKKPEFEGPTRGDFQMATQASSSLPVTLVNDGIVLEDNLKASGYNRTWLEKQLDNQGYNRPEEVFYAEWDENQGLFVVPMPKEEMAK